MTDRAQIATTIARLYPWAPLLATGTALYCQGVPGWAPYTWYAHALISALTLARMQPRSTTEGAAILAYIAALMFPIEGIGLAFTDVRPALQVLASLIWIIICMLYTPDVITRIGKSQSSR